MNYRTLILAAACLASACATSPLDTRSVNSQVSPSQVVGAMPAQRGTTVQWGGHIVSTVNRENSTFIEVLSYPLARDGFPNTNRKPTGRFVLRRQGFLEPQDYAPGRELTVVGDVQSLIETSVGETELLVPLVRAEQLHLWDDQYKGRSGPRFGFGLGINIGL